MARWKCKICGKVYDELPEEDGKLLRCRACGCQPVYTKMRDERIRRVVKAI